MINWGELDNRLDPRMALYQRKTTLFQHPAIRLSNLLKANPQYGANETGITRHLHDEPRYIRITDIDEYGLLKPEVGKTAEIVNPQYLLTNNDILLARSGATVGKSYIHKTGSISYPCFFAGYMIRFIVDTDKVLPDYVFAFTQLDTYYEWVSAIQRAAGQPNINAEEYKSLGLLGSRFKMYKSIQFPRFSIAVTLQIT